MSGSKHMLTSFAEHPPYGLHRIFQRACDISAHYDLRIPTMESAMKLSQLFQELLVAYASASSGAYADRIEP